MINAEGMDSRITILIVIKDQTIRGLVFLSPNQPSIGVHLVNSMGLVAARAALADQAYLQLNSRPAARQILRRDRRISPLSRARARRAPA